MDRAWIVKRGDAYAIDTNYMKQVAIFRPEGGNIMRGNEPNDPKAQCLGYLRAMTRHGVQIDEHIPD